MVRSIDVAKTLGVTKPSVSRAMGKLKDAGLIEMDENNKIVFTKKGKKEAEEQAKREQEEREAKEREERELQEQEQRFRQQQAMRLRYKAQRLNDEILESL